jgi:hypothetical protein
VIEGFNFEAMGIFGLDFVGYDHADISASANQLVSMGAFAILLISLNYLI